MGLKKFDPDNAPKDAILMESKLPDRVEPEGLSDGGHIQLFCANCRAGLMDIWMTRPHEEFEYTVRATCPWCGDKSFEQPIKGGIHYGGFGVPKEDDEDETIPSTQVISSDLKDGAWLFQIGKANDKAKPIYRKD